MKKHKKIGDAGLILKFSNEKISVEILLNDEVCSSRSSSRRKCVLYWQDDPSNIQQGRKSGNWSKVARIAIKGSVAVIHTGSTIFPTNIRNIRRPLDTVDLEELPDSRERTGKHLFNGSLAEDRQMSGKRFQTILVLSGHSRSTRTFGLQHQ